ncbi:MAG: TrkH family potassium uptake protein [Candidatus Delongbacteria bacterium]|nr:TrkH family potassium uptake protein [Candidatus Delongbacteria bacterium]
MRIKVISRLMGLLIIFLAWNMLPSMLWSIYYNEPVWRDFVFSIALFTGIGLAMIAFGHDQTNTSLYKKEALTIVTFSWLIAGLMGAFPFFTSGYIPHYVDAFFETISGFTTTGASILSDIEVLPKGLLFWRSYTHWLGGMGIIVLFLALIPFVGASGKRMYQFEVPGPDVEGLKPKIQSTSMILWGIYLGITVLILLLLRLAGMNWFDSFCHTFGAIGTGGFSTKNLSIGYYQNLWIHGIILLAIILAATNFSIHYYFIKRKFSLVFKDWEFRAYYTLMLGASLVIAWILFSQNIFSSFWKSWLYAAFNSISMMTSTGYATTDFDLWPVNVKIIIFILMFVGGCGGSTSGGIKIVRFLILFKYGYNQIVKSYSPQRKFILRLGDKLIDRDVVKRTMVFFFLYIVLYIVGVFCMSCFHVDWMTAFSSVAACFNTAGPGFSQVGPMVNYGFLHPAAKLILTFFMIAGRLEIFALLVFFIPDFWKR